MDLFCFGRFSLGFLFVMVLESMYWLSILVFLMYGCQKVCFGTLFLEGFCVWILRSILFRWWNLIQIYLWSSSPKILLFKVRIWNWEMNVSILVEFHKISISKKKNDSRPTYSEFGSMNVYFVSIYGILKGNKTHYGSKVVLNPMLIWSTALARRRKK